MSLIRSYKGRQVRIVAKTGDGEQELLHANEPFFLVRAQDRLAPLLVGIYAALVDNVGLDTADLHDLRTQMRDWQIANPALTKLPD